MPATPEPIVTDHGGEVEVNIPAGVMYAALAMRLNVGDEEAAGRVMLGLADRFALVVQEFNDTMHDGKVTIVTGAEAIVAHETAAEMTALHHGLDPYSRVTGVDIDALADHLRLASIMGTHGGDVTAALAWDQLSDSDKRRWRELSKAVAEYIRGAEAIGDVG